MRIVALSSAALRCLSSRQGGAHPGRRTASGFVLRQRLSFSTSVACQQCSRTTLTQRACVQLRLRVQLERQQPGGPVVALRYPSEKQEFWWLIVGDGEDNVLAIKRLTCEARNASRKPLTRGKLAGGIETPCTATARRLQRHSKRQRGRVNAPRGR